eukprot:SAG11_NODE_5443_length_1558_cov_1.884167_2_plen_40_part_00
MHLDACSMLKVTPKEHANKWRRSKKHYAAHEGSSKARLI